MYTYLTCIHLYHPIHATSLKPRAHQYAIIKLNMSWAGLFIPALGWP